MVAQALRELEELEKKARGKTEEASTTAAGDTCKRPKKPFVQLLVRMLVNVEALNMVESVGNVTRHRTVPVIYAKGPGEYYVRWVPAVSGETLAHRYQEEIVELALQDSGCRNRVDYWSMQKEFLKHWDLKFYQQQCQQSNLKPFEWECQLASKYAGARQGTLDQIRDIEETIVKNSVVEDIAGFLVTQGPTRRTSCIRFSYALPTMDALDASQIDHQMHVRGALKAQSLRIKGYEEAIQIPYYVQIGSVLYGFNVDLDLGCVGCLSTTREPVSDEQCGLERRRCIAVKALRPLVDGDFGAKRSRYRPHNQLELVIAVVSDQSIPLPPATLPLHSLLGELAAKLKAYKELGASYELAALVPPGIPYRDKLLEQVQNSLGKLDVYETTSDFLKALEKLAGLQC